MTNLAILNEQIKNSIEGKIDLFLTFNDVSTAILNKLSRKETRELAIKLGFKNHIEMQNLLNFKICIYNQDEYFWIGYYKSLDNEITKRITHEKALEILNFKECSDFPRKFCTDKKYVSTNKNYHEFWNSLS